ncbi:MAG: hypothetical protein WDO71_03045 [Bacteroidota bacterium]
MYEYTDKPWRVPAQLLYHMATGSGKNPDHGRSYYLPVQQRLSQFSLFVNSSGIIDKTKDNFLNRSSSNICLRNTFPLVKNK